MISPETFQRQFLRRKLWSKQQELCRAIATHRSVSVKGCHGSGKSFCVAGMVPYELITQEETIVITTAPTLRQVKNLWSEIEAAIQALPMCVPDRTATGWALSEKCKAIGFSSAKGVNAQGYHGKRVLIIVDEAIGVSADVWEAIEGIRAAGDVRIVKMCNPTVPSGAPYEDFTKLRGSTYCLTISAFDTPNLAGLTMESLLQLPDSELDYAPFPHLTRRRWVREMYYKWGPNNPRFMSRVLGEFPTQADNAVFRLEWVEAAGLPYEKKDLQPYFRPGMYIQVGVDVAGPGADETTATARLGPYVVLRDSWMKADPLEEVHLFLSELHNRFPGASVVVLGDTVGIGYHFMRGIAHKGYDVRAFIAGAAPIDSVMFRNAKAEAYWWLRECMRDGHVLGVEDEDTRAQLTDIRYRELPGGQIEIEHKDELRARGGSSPDRAESLIMAWARLVPKQETHILNPAGSYQIGQY